MKKCPYCAESIQDKAIVCRYCGRELVPGAVKQVKARMKKSSQWPDGFDENWKLPADYTPPPQDIDSIHGVSLQRLQKGEWILLTDPPLAGYVPRNYNGRVSGNEYAELKEEILNRAWSKSDKSPEDLEEKLYAAASAIKGPILSAKAKWLELAAYNARDSLISKLHAQYSRDAIEKAYREGLERLVRYALLRPRRGEDLPPLERLERIDADRVFPEAKERPEEFLELLLSEAKRQVRSLSVSPS